MVTSSNCARLRPSHREQTTTSDEAGRNRQDTSQAKGVDVACRDRAPTLVRSAHKKSPRKTRDPGGEDDADSGSDWIVRRFGTSCDEPRSNEIRPHGFRRWPSASMLTTGDAIRRRRCFHLAPSAGHHHVLARVRREVMGFARKGQERFFSFRRKSNASRKIVANSSCFATRKRSFPLALELHHGERHGRSDGGGDDDRR